MGATLHVTLGDDHGRTTKRKIGMETEATLAAYTTNITAWAAAFDNVTDFSLLKTTLQIDVTGDEFAVVADANIDTGGKFSGWLDDVPTRRASLRIPGVKLSLVGADGTIANTGATAVYTALFETAAKFNLARGFQISTWVKGTLDK